jgi:flagellar basal-body rod modification protein FlgD
MTPTDFINMLVAELQNQDPTQPVSNTQILQEVSQISNIETNQTLSTSLQSVLMGQNLATASGLLQKTVTATDTAGNSITGTVSSISVSNGTATLNIGNQTATLSNVTGILPAGSTASTSSTTGN